MALPPPRIAPRRGATLTLLVSCTPMGRHIPDGCRNTTATRTYGALAVAYTRPTADAASHIDRWFLSPVRYAASIGDSLIHP